MDAKFIGLKRNQSDTKQKLTLKTSKKNIGSSVPASVCRLFAIFAHVSFLKLVCETVFSFDSESMFRF